MSDLLLNNEGGGGMSGGFPFTTNTLVDVQCRTHKVSQPLHAISQAADNNKHTCRKFFVRFLFPGTTTTHPYAVSSKFGIYFL